MGLGGGSASRGITIDVAYRFFTTEKRKFIVADTPGHEQYTRNMVTGASTADLAVILVDARKGVLTQTRRHSYLAQLVGIRHIVLAVNKMDLVSYEQKVFDEIVADYAAFARGIGIEAFVPIPISGFKGDNIASLSANTPWYDGPVLIDHLEDVEVDNKTDQARPLRLPVQWVNRPNLDFRGLFRADRERIGQAGRCRARAALGQDQHRGAHRDHAEWIRFRGRNRWRWRSRRSGGGSVGDAHAGRRDRLLARRRDCRRRQPATGRRPVRGGDRGMSDEALKPAGPIGSSSPPRPSRRASSRPNMRSTSTRWSIWRPGRWS